MWVDPEKSPEPPSDAIYLAFQRLEADNVEEPTLFESLYRLAQGPYVHAEIVVRRGRKLVRYVVGRPTTANLMGKVFRTETVPERSQVDWDFLHLEFNEAVATALEGSRLRGDYYSKRAKLVSGCPHMPEFVYDLVLGKQPQLVPGARPVFCASHILHALQVGGLLAFYPADKCGASDLYALALRYTGAVPCLSPFPHVEVADALGLAVSSETAAASF